MTLWNRVKNVAESHEKRCSSARKRNYSPLGICKPCVLWGPRGLQVHGFESCPQSKCSLGFLTRGNGFLAATLSRTRGHSLKILVPHHSTEVRRRFFSLRVINIWNSLPEIVVSAQSLQSFKHVLEKFLGHRLYEYC
ncbi:hypothetical protein E2C01_035671 [Portunus trituberculatus]|uniref:Uncharacterized protein n=1 Tax=Portunus trituberculatus TaxID=210409 RepID=A0A5B7F9Y7_PORTR|nr:hypothetical protein [Portunus trituberculatus]